MPHVTVLMAVYNEEERFLRTAIESILHQTHTNIEFIVVDDASTDKECLVVLESYAHTGSIVLIKNQENLGLTVSLNKGLEQATGKYLARIDSNDLAHPERLTEQVNFMESHPEYALCGSWSHLINEDDEIVGQKKFYTDYQEIRDNILRFNFFTHSSLLFDLEKLRKIGGYSPKMKKAQDYDLILRLVAQYPVAILPKFLCFYRLLPTSISEKTYKKQERYAVHARWDALLSRKYPFWEAWKVFPATLSFFIIPKKMKIFLVKKIWKKYS